MKYPMRSPAGSRTGLAVKLETRKHENRVTVKPAVGERPRLRQELQETVAFLNPADASGADLLEDPLPQKSNVKKRQCLCCSAVFTSEWAGERVCQKCKASNGWRSGVSSG